MMKPKNPNNYLKQNKKLKNDQSIETAMAMTLENSKWVDLMILKIITKLFYINLMMKLRIILCYR